MKKCPLCGKTILVDRCPDCGYRIPEIASQSMTSNRQYSYSNNVEELPDIINANDIKSDKPQQISSKALKIIIILFLLPFIGPFVLMFVVLIIFLIVFAINGFDLEDIQIENDSISIDIEATAPETKYEIVDFKEINN